MILRYLIYRTCLDGYICRPASKNVWVFEPGQCVHTSAVVCRQVKRRSPEPPKPRNWLKYNDIVYPPTPEGAPRRPAVSLLVYVIVLLSSLQCSLECRRISLIHIIYEV